MRRFRSFVVLAAMVAAALLSVAGAAAGSGGVTGPAFYVDGVLYRTVGTPTTSRLVDPVSPMLRNAIMMPHTVPNSPMNGATLAVVASSGIRRSSLFSSTTDARVSDRSTAVKLFRVGR